jgi:hypothetical protein
MTLAVAPHTACIGSTGELRPTHYLKHQPAMHLLHLTSCPYARPTAAATLPLTSALLCPGPVRSPLARISWMCASPPATGGRHQLPPQVGSGDAHVYSTTMMYAPALSITYCHTYLCTYVSLMSSINTRFVACVYVCKLQCGLRCVTRQCGLQAPAEAGSRRC